MTKPDHPSGPRVQVGLRLPPAHAERLKQIAEAKNRSQSDVVAKMIERAVWSEGEAGWAVDEIAPLPELPVHPDPEAHTHFKRRETAQGLAICECGAIRGIDDVWRSTSELGPCQHGSTRVDDLLGRVCKRCGVIVDKEEGHRK